MACRGSSSFGVPHHHRAGWRSLARVRISTFSLAQDEILHPSCHPVPAREGVLPQSTGMTDSFATSSSSSSSSS